MKSFCSARRVAVTRTYRAVWPPAVTVCGRVPGFGASAAVRSASTVTPVAEGPGRR